MILCYMHVFFTALATGRSSSADCYDAKSSSRIITIAFFHFLMAQQRSLALDLICARLPSIILLLLLHDARLQQWKRRSKRHTVAAVVNSKDVTTIMITLGYTDIHYFEQQSQGQLYCFFRRSSSRCCLSLPEGIQCIITTVTVFLSLSTTLFAFKIGQQQWRRIKYQVYVNSF